MMKNALKIAVAALALVATQANAGRFNFSYVTGSGGLLTGQVQGTLQADNDAVVVSQVIFSDFNWMGGPGLPIIDSGSARFSGGLQPATLSLSGTQNDFYSCTDALCNDGFAFLPAGIFGPTSVHIAGPSFGSSFEVYDAANWSMNAVPEPASWAMLIAGFGLTGATLRRRRMLQAA